MSEWKCKQNGILENLICYSNNFLSLFLSVCLCGYLLILLSYIIYLVCLWVYFLILIFYACYSICLQVITSFSLSVFPSVYILSFLSSCLSLDLFLTNLERFQCFLSFWLLETSVVVFLFINFAVLLSMTSFSAFSFHFNHFLFITFVSYFHLLCFFFYLSLLFRQSLSQCRHKTWIQISSTWPHWLSSKPTSFWFLKTLEMFHRLDLRMFTYMLWSSG